MKYIHRSIEPVLQKAAKQFPAVVLTGPRQSGKTTLLKRIFGGTHRYVTLDDTELRAFAVRDPKGFLAELPPPLILDEVQYAPGLLGHVKMAIDDERGSLGRYLLTGSQNLLLSQDVTETLAGRAAVLRLMPLSFRESAGDPDRPLAWEAGRRTKASSWTGPSLWKRILEGGYPELAAQPDRDHGLWFMSYVQTYLERDVRALRQVGDLSQFQVFLKTLAARSGQLLNLSGLSRDLGVAVNTAKAWISVLEASHQVTVVRPYYRNIGKRLVKTPKVYLTDTGLLCHLTGLKDPEHLRLGPLGGPALETAVIGEIDRVLAARGQAPALYFWRTSNGVEVDLVVETGGRLIPIEIKTSLRPNEAMIKGIASFQKDYQKVVQPGYLVHTGKDRAPLARGVESLPLAEL